MKLRSFIKKQWLVLLFLCAVTGVQAQTDMDAIMMYKHNFCSGLTYQSSGWKSYWEGTFKRENHNLGKVSTKMYAVMGNYGITNNLNVLFGLPYVKTKASAGTMHPMKGLQDLSLWVKWRPFSRQAGKGVLSLFTIGGYALPVTDYTADFQPLSIGMQSKNLSLRGMADYQLGDWFATASATYVRRSNITIDRYSYFTTTMHYSNRVEMPDAAQYNLRAGFRNHHWIVEVVGTKWNTLGGFDIAKNNMPFPSNRMNMTSAGLHVKYETHWLKGLSLIGGGDHTLSGRNVGQAKGFYAGAFYAVNFAKH